VLFRQQLARGKQNSPTLVAGAVDFVRARSESRRPCLTILLLLPLLIGQTQDRTVLLASHRSGRIEVLDPDTLQPLGSVKVLPMADGIVSSPGGIMFLREGLAPGFLGCCALYALDLKTRSMTKLLRPVSGIATSLDGKHVVT
jgi:hypothetical protein